MAQCKSCGNSNFDLVDGVYFCSICQTASQDFRDEHVDEGALVGTLHGLHIRSKKECVKAEELDFGLVWTTIDAFNIIIKQMVDVLLELGISSDVADVVQHLWFEYLRLTEYAFCKTSDGTDWFPKLPTFARERDVQVMLHGEAKIIATKYRRSVNSYHSNQKRILKKTFRELSKIPRKSKGGQKGKGKADSQELVISEELGDGGGRDGDVEPSNKSMRAEDEAEPPRKKTKRESMNIVEMQIRDKVHVRLRKTVRAHHLKAVERMTLKRVFEFIYLGVLLCDNSVLLCDLISWVEDNHLPLRQAASLLPEDMKFQTHDCSTFRLIKPLLNESVRIDVAKLARFLGIAVIPPKSLEEIVARFVAELNLPLEMIRLIRSLILKNPPIMTCMPMARVRMTYAVPNYEGRALGFIVVVFKLLFGLDGKTEIEQAKYARRINTILDDINPFMWDEWYQFARGRNLMVAMHSKELGTKKPINVGKADEIVQHYLNVETKARGKRGIRHTLTPRNRDSVRDPVRKPFAALFDKLEEPKPAPPPTSFPESSKANEALSDSDPPVPDATRADFGRTSLEIFVRPETLKERLRLNNYELCVVRNSAWNRAAKTKGRTRREPSEDVSANTTTDVFDLSQDLFPEPDVPECELTVYQPAYSYIKVHFGRGRTCRYANLSANFPPLYKGLMEICARIGRMSERDLYYEVMLIERVLFHEKTYNRCKQNSFNALLKWCW